jgi:hypothetical protein
MMVHLKKPITNPEYLLQKVLKECAVKPSLDLGLCGDPENFVFAGDGAPLETGASPYGKKGLPV